MQALTLFHSLFLALYVCDAVDSERFTMVELMKQFSALKTYVTLQEERIEALERKIDLQRREIWSIKDKMNRKMFRKNEDKEVPADCVKESPNSISGTRYITRGRLARQAEPKIAFSSYIDHVIRHIGINSIIPFDKILINDGGAYNPVTGIFTVPVTGVYLFTYTINTNVEAYQLVVKLVMDGINMSDGTSDPFHKLQEIQGGNTVIFRANQGQSIWLAAYNINDTTADSKENYRYCTLSAALLYT